MLPSFESPQYSEVELDFEESEVAVQEGLRLAREQKFFRLKRESYNKKIAEQEKFETKTAEQLFETYCQFFKFADAIHEKKVKQLCCYFANDSRFNGDLKRGLLLMGGKGTGKTQLMKLFSANQNHSFRLELMLDISFDYKQHGEKGVEIYNSNFKTTPNFFGKTECGYCFDDLMTEDNPAKYMGQTKNIFSEIIQLRYHKQLPFNSTHAITNYEAKDLEEAYGTIAYDRMKEMFNVVTFDHDSFRTN